MSITQCRRPPGFRQSPQQRQRRSILRPRLEPLEDRVVPSQLAWEDQLDLSNFEQAFSVAPLNDQVFVSGFTSNANFDRDFLIRAYDVRTGELHWQDQVDKGSDEFASGVITDENRVFVSGNVYIPGRGYDWIVRAYEAGSGALLWESVVDFAAKDDFCRGTAFAVENGTLFLGGYVTNAQGNLDWAVRAYHSSSGQAAWENFVDIGDDFVRSLSADEGRVFVGGGIDGASVDRVLLCAYDAKTGEILWEQNTPNAYFPKVKTHEGQVLVGSTLATGSQKAYMLIQTYDGATGALLWQDQVDKGGQLDSLEDLDVQGGRVFAVGFGGLGCIQRDSPPSDCEALIRTYDHKTGTLLWERESDLSGGFDDLAKLVVADKGTVFTFSLPHPEFIGQTEMGQWTVQAFDSATGQLRWESKGGPVETALYNMVVHRGRLIIPGRAADPNTFNWDWLVRAYYIRSDGGGGWGDSSNHVFTDEIWSGAGVNHRGSVDREGLDDLIAGELVSTMRREGQVDILADPDADLAPRLKRFHSTTLADRDTYLTYVRETLDGLFIAGG